MVVRVEGAFALEMQHLAPLVIERVNTHLGWRGRRQARAQAGAGRARLPRRSRAPPLDPGIAARVAEQVAGVADQALRDALERLGRMRVSACEARSAGASTRLREQARGVVTILPQSRWPLWSRNSRFRATSIRKELMTMTNRRQLLTGASRRSRPPRIAGSPPRGPRPQPTSPCRARSATSSLGSRPTPRSRSIEYASLTCSHCATFHERTWPALKSKYIDTGKVRFMLREFPLDPLATAGFMLARCAGDDKYYADHRSAVRAAEELGLHRQAGRSAL